MLELVLLARLHVGTQKTSSKLHLFIHFLSFRGLRLFFSRRVRASELTQQFHQPQPEMPYPRERRSTSPHSSPSPLRGRRSRSLSRSRRSRSRSHESVDASNPGNNLYVTGLSTRVTSTDLEKFFNKEGKVLDCHLVKDPRTRESRGFGFVTMETVEDAERCIKHLDRSVLEGRLVTVEKAKRKRGRTPTPGRYQGLRDKRGRNRDHDPRRSRSFSPRRLQDRDPYPRDRRGRSRSPYGRRADEHSDSYRRPRERSLSGGRNPR